MRKIQIKIIISNCIKTKKELDIKLDLEFGAEILLSEVMSLIHLSTSGDQLLKISENLHCEFC